MRAPPHLHSKELLLRANNKRKVSPAGERRNSPVNWGEKTLAECCKKCRVRDHQHCPNARVRGIWGRTRKRGNHNRNEWLITPSGGNCHQKKAQKKEHCRSWRGGGPKRKGDTAWGGKGVFPKKAGGGCTCRKVSSDFHQEPRQIEGENRLERKVLGQPESQRGQKDSLPLGRKGFPSALRGQAGVVLGENDGSREHPAREGYVRRKEEQERGEESKKQKGSCSKATR